MMEPLRRKNLQSTILAPNKTIIDNKNQIICLKNKPLSSVKEFIVKIPVTDMKNMAPKSNQSIFLINRAKYFVSYFYPRRNFFANARGYIFVDSF